MKEQIESVHGKLEVDVWKEEEEERETEVERNEFLEYTIIYNLIEISYIETKRKDENINHWRYWMPRICLEAEIEW